MSRAPTHCSRITGKAVDLYSQAIKLDPDFALARAHLSSTCAEIFHFQEPLDLWKDRARVEAETALRLQPDLGEAHFALGQCAYWFDNDYARALSEFAIAQNLLPNDSNIGAYVAAIRRRQGHWEEALATYRADGKARPAEREHHSQYSLHQYLDAALAPGGASGGPFSRRRAGFGRGQNSNRLCRVSWKGDVGAVSALGGRYSFGTIPTAS